MSINVYLFELKAKLKSTVVWGTTIVGALLVFMAFVYPVFADSVGSILNVIKGFPPEFAAAFGFDIGGMFSFGGFYGFSFGYIALIGADMAVSLSISAFAREKQAKCTDFLLTKPISREGVFISKLASGITLLLTLNIVFIVVSTILGVYNDIPSGQMILASVSLLLTQLVFYALGVVYAVTAKRVRSVSGIATAISFGAFILSALVNILEDEKVRFIAPLKYFDPTALLTNGIFEWQYAVTGVVVVVACLVASFYRYTKDDISAI